mmetsp:Transcript_14743/g.26649  ORF Transcript_14743/g.26649 Transcript_14743/m.26649 type:complete len:83 (+) Transcript_14743:853-1101(+)
MGAKCWWSEKMQFEFVEEIWMCYIWEKYDHPFELLPSSCARAEAKMESSARHAPGLQLHAISLETWPTYVGMETTPTGRRGM